jgi:PIN domain nuclease of toxin-antitoxin system
VRLLLDTHIWIWTLVEPGRLAPRVIQALGAADAELWLSPISIWETLVLIERGRLRVQGDAVRWVEGMVRATPQREAPLTHEVALVSRVLALPHDDPADRFLAATAKVHDLTLVTADRRLLQSTEFATLAN